MNYIEFIAEAQSANVIWKRSEHVADIIDIFEQLCAVSETMRRIFECSDRPDDVVAFVPFLKDAYSKTDIREAYFSYKGKINTPGVPAHLIYMLKRACVDMYDGEHGNLALWYVYKNISEYAKYKFSTEQGIVTLFDIVYSIFNVKFECLKTDRRNTDDDEVYIANTDRIAIIPRALWSEYIKAPVTFMEGKGLVDAAGNIVRRMDNKIGLTLSDYNLSNVL